MCLVYITMLGSGYRGNATWSWSLQWKTEETHALLKALGRVRSSIEWIQWMKAYWVCVMCVVCACVHMHMNVCVCTHTSAHLCMCHSRHAEVRWQPYVFVLTFHLVWGRQGLLLPPIVYSRVADPQAPRDFSCLCLPSHYMGFVVPDSHTTKSSFMWILGSELRSYAHMARTLATKSSPKASRENITKVFCKTTLIKIGPGNEQLNPKSRG